MREAGILLHLSSLPGKYGVGTLGKCAYDFVDFLKKSGQKIWQILPIGPTSYGDSPYSSTSAFAFNPYFVDLDLLVEDGLLEKEDLPYPFQTNRVNYDYLYSNKYPILHKAYLKSDIYKNEFEKFIKDEDSWLDDYAMFVAIKEWQGNMPWYEWYHNERTRNKDSLNWLKNEFKKDRIREIKFYQFLFYKQFIALKEYANNNGISIMGDMPIYCAYDSADVWANPKDFKLDHDLKPIGVAGCPPDAFSEDGQLWGNPLYDWDKMKKDGYQFWIKRVKHSFKLFDILRIDHFRGFAGYYSIPYGDSNAKGGHWEKGPGYDLFKAINKAVPNARIIAENLGFLTADVTKLLNKCNYPGMNIFQFELGDCKHAQIKKGFNQNNVFYTGTHDNQTIMSFYNSLNKDYKKLVDTVCGIILFDRPNLKIIEYSMNTACDIVIIPIQDYLGLSDDLGRMNLPSTVSNSNWSYISRDFDYSNDLAKYIKNITKASKR